MAVVSNNRRPRASIRSLLPNFQFLAEEKYPSKSWPEEEGKLTVSAFVLCISVERHMGAAILEVTIEILQRQQAQDFKALQIEAALVVARENQHRMCVAKPLLQCYGFGN
jgi:hypothetical protein